MGLFDIFGGQQPKAAPQMGPREMQRQMRHDIDEISSNPASFLAAKGLQIPEGMTDAKQITQYLLQTKQIGTPRLQQVVSMLGGMPGRR